MKETFLIEKRSGKPVIMGRSLFDQYFQVFEEGQRFDVVFQPRGQRPSGRQRGYYFAVIVKATRLAINESWGEYWSLERTHDFLKYHCLFKEKINEVTGEVLRVPGSITGNDTWDQEEYHERCRRFVKDNFSVDIPLPNEQSELFT